MINLRNQFLKKEMQVSSMNYHHFLEKNLFLVIFICQQKVTRFKASLECTENEINKNIGYQKENNKRILKAWDSKRNNRLRKTSPSGVTTIWSSVFYIITKFVRDAKSSFYPVTFRDWHHESLLRKTTRTKKKKNVIKIRKTFT